jgi:hypothetical protein
MEEIRGDVNLFWNMKLDTPFITHKDHLRLTEPGVHVKRIGKKGNYHHNEDFGVLVSHSDTLAVVRTFPMHGDIKQDDLIVWRMTPEEYERTWEVD